MNQAVGAFFPTIKLSGNYTDIHSDPQVLQVNFGGAVQTFAVSSANATKTWNATLVTRSCCASSGVRNGAERQRRGLPRTCLRPSSDTSYDVTSAYYGVLSADELTTVAEDSLALAKSHLAQVQAMLNGGMVTKADLLRAEVQEVN